MAEAYTDVRALYTFQDHGHTETLHSVAANETVPHLGMFIFDFGFGHTPYLNFEFVLNVISVSKNFSDRRFMGRFMLGTFTSYNLVLENSFLDQSSLDACGWQPIKVPYGTTQIKKELYYDLYSDVFDTFSREVKFSFHFTMTEIDDHLGLLFVPAQVARSGDGAKYTLKFYGDRSNNRAYVRCTHAIQSLFLNESSNAVDNTKHYGTRLIDNKDVATSQDSAQQSVGYYKNDSGELKEEPYQLKIGGNDPATNYSMSIRHIALKDEGHLIEIYGFNGYTERYYYPDSAIGFDFAKLQKLNYSTWSGILVEKPWCTLLWYGELIYFADLEEFGKCNRLYFKEQSEQLCPVCGNPIGPHLDLSFVDITRIPHQFYFCSKECKHTFNGNLKLYLQVLTKSNMQYWAGINI